MTTQGHVDLIEFNESGEMTKSEVMIRPIGARSATKWEPDRPAMGAAGGGTAALS